MEESIPNSPSNYENSITGWPKKVDGFGVESFNSPLKVQKTETCFDFEPYSKGSANIAENSENNSDKRLKFLFFSNEILEDLPKKFLGFLGLCHYNSRLVMGNKLIC